MDEGKNEGSRFNEMWNGNLFNWGQVPASSVYCMQSIKIKNNFLYFKLTLILIRNW
jgi:hypothetical protein